MLTFVTGDFFDFNANIRVNTVNCVGVMGAGVALQFKNRFPKMYEDYVRECNLGKVRIGKPHVWVDNDIFSSSPIIINFPTKDDWKKPSEYEYVEKGLVWLRDYLKNRNNVSITVPALGCGHGGLDWSIVKVMIEDHLKDLEANILVFEPSSSTKTEIPEEQLAALKSASITRIAPNDIEYPERLRGRTATEIYIKGDKNVFQSKLFSIIVDAKANEREKAAIFSCVDGLPNGDFVYLLSYNSSFEIDLLKAVIKKKAKIVLLFPYGILNVNLRKDIKEIWDDSNITLVSISKPKQSWSAYESINSLKFRIRISNVILITNYEIDNLRKLEKEFKEAGNPIFFVNYWNERIDFFSLINARQIGRDKKTNKPNLLHLYENLQA